MPSLATQTTPAPSPVPDRQRAAKIVAKSMYRELRAGGYDTRQIVAVATTLIGLVTEELREDEM